MSPNFRHNVMKNLNHSHKLDGLIRLCELARTLLALLSLAEASKKD